MNHLPFLQTPITYMAYMSRLLGCNMFCKRDDLFMEAYGGNKARMLQYILFQLTEHKYDVLITAGPKSSNFNRACALMCAKMGIRMHLVLYSSLGESEASAFNSKICELTNISITRCKKEDTAWTIKNVIDSYGNQKVLSVYGGGRSLEGIYAYYDAIEELSHQIEHIDHLFVPCGTGTTLTGICAGMQKWFPNAQVHAISISRKYEDEVKILDEDMFWLNSYLSTRYNFSNLQYSDDFLCGGYGMYDSEIIDAIKNVMSYEGLIFDPCYTGKAWNGTIKKILNCREYYAGKNVIFWHTGGIFNLLSVL